MGHLDKELRHVSAVSATKPLSVTKLVEKIVQTNWPVKNVGNLKNNFAVRSLQKRTHWPNTLKHSKLQGHQVQNESSHVTLNGIMLPKLQYVTWKTMKSRENSPSTNYCWKSATFTSLKTLKTSVSNCF